MRRSDYRADIDGLRALAILPVIWFHSGLPGLPGGFTGVDTFFVISGFLITGIIHREVAEGTFTFTRFYERRIRRIAPALLVTLSATMIVGSLILLPYEFVKLAEAAISALFMVPNIYFWQEAGYFRLGEGITPLLHMWSLGVEEQFYLIFPIFLIVAQRLRIVKPAIAVAAVASFVLCIVATRIFPSAAFYLLPTRAWELMLGALLAVGAINIPASLRNIASLAGLALLVLSAAIIGKGSQFPGWMALMPAMGATMLIGSGGSAVANGLLARGILVWIGKISYSLYLWHWPVFAFLRHFRADPQLPVGWSVIGIALSVALAWVSYRLVEQPARRPAVPYRKIGGLASIGAAAVMAICGGVLLTSGVPQRFDQNVIMLASQKDDLAPLAHKCEVTPLDRIDQECAIGKTPAKVLVWGDSHAAAVSTGVAEGFLFSTVIASMNNCAPSIGWISPALVGREVDRCATRNAALLDRVLGDPSIEMVVLVANWPAHERSGGEAMWRGTQKLISSLRSKQIIVLAGTPMPDFDVPWVSAIRQRFGRPEALWTCPKADVRLHNAAIIDLSAAYCAHPNQNRLFTDGNHPSLTANREVIAPALRKWLGNFPGSKGTAR